MNTKKPCLLSSKVLCDKIEDRNNELDNLRQIMNRFGIFSSFFFISWMIPVAQRVTVKLVARTV